MTLRVFTPYCNPIGWSSRLKNHRRFEDAIFATSGVALTTIELTYGDRPFDLPPRARASRACGIGRAMSSGTRRI